MITIKITEIAVSKKEMASILRDIADSVEMGRQEGNNPSWELSGIDEVPEEEE